MKFSRCIWEKNPAREWTPRRMAAAKRRVQREADAVPLFPELAKVKSVEEDVAIIDRDSVAYHRRLRKSSSDGWRKARRLLEGMGNQGQGIRRYWQSNAYFPRDAYYLLGFIRDVQVKHVCFWRRLRILRQLTLIREGKLPHSVIQSIRAWD